MDEQDIELSPEENDRFWAWLIESGELKILSAWINAQPDEEPKAGRNEPCPCGSGRKFKKCCGGNNEQG